MYNLKTIREAKGFSQSQLATAAGVPVRMIRAYEAEAATAHKDINKAEALTVYKLSEALGCGIAELLELDNGSTDNM